MVLYLKHKVCESKKYLNEKRWSLRVQNPITRIEKIKYSDASPRSPNHIPSSRWKNYLKVSLKQN